jgi:hypothetical protein
VAAIITITAGNFRLIDRLMAQVRRIKEINKLNTVTREVVDAARDCHLTKFKRAFLFDAARRHSAVSTSGSPC